MTNSYSSEILIGVLENKPLLQVHILFLEFGHLDLLFREGRLYCGDRVHCGRAKLVERQEY